MVHAMQNEPTDFRLLESSFCDLSAFEFFGIQAQFLINEQFLRTRYFEICRYFSTKKEILKKTHENYKKLQNPISRLDEIFEVFNVTKKYKNERIVNNSELNANLLEYYDEPYKYIKNIENLIMEIQKEIQTAFNELDWDQIFLLRDKLAYCTKFQDLAYASKKD
jgi:hypothetical protein